MTSIRNPARRSAWILLATVVVFALAKTVATLAMQPAWISVTQMNTRLYTDGRPVFRVMVRAHGFAAPREVSCSVPSGEARNLGPVRIRDLPLGQTASFLLSVAPEEPETIVELTAAYERNRVTRRITLGASRP